MNKKAILIVSFGTSYEETRKKTIDVLENRVAEEFKDYRVYGAWTSKMIINKIRKRDNIIIPTVKEALEQMIKDGVTDVILQPTHIINGIENDNMRKDAHVLRKNFNTMKFGTPLLTTEDDNLAVVNAIAEEFKYLSPESALVLMGHGTEHYANSIYAAMDYRFKAENHKNIFMGTVEGYPDIDTVIKYVNLSEPEKIVLAPFMFVAGDHATNDMSGDDPDSWLNVFTKEGYKTEAVIKGLGEYRSIQEIYINHIRKVMEI